MSDPSTSAPKFNTPAWNERLDPWASAFLTLSLHLLMLLMLLNSNPPRVTSPQGSAGGGRVKVDFVGETPPSKQLVQTPPTTKPQKPSKPRPKSPVRRKTEDRKPVLEAKYIEPPSEPEQNQHETPAIAESTQPPAASPPETVQRQPQTWTGRPPGSMERETSPNDNGRAQGPGNRMGPSRARATDGPAMEIGGYQIVYDLLSERRLRAWMDEGMEEISFPLPGSTYLMVCPAEVALRRGSSKCRLLAPDSPELKSIGDARETVTVMYVYRYGEQLWQGPGPYR